MKQNITLAIDRTLLKKARGLAAQRGTSISGLLAAELQKLVQTDEEYQQAKTRALALLASPPFRLGGKGMGNREALHDRQSLR
jgi:hypothetical protein